MPNRLKHKLSRVITSFQLCRSKDPSCPEAPAPAIHRLSPFNPKALDINYPCNLPAPPPSTPYYKCQVSRKTMSVGCKCQSRSCPRCCMSDWSIESPDFACKEEARWQAKPHLNVPFSFSDESGDMSPFMVTGKNKNGEINIKKNKVKTGVLSVDTSGCFSSTDVAGEENETLLCTSRSFSYDSSCEFSHSLDTIARKSEYHEAFNKPIGNKKVISRKVDGRVKESVAVVKKSQNPHRDFKRSMLEMILERQIFEAEDLEELLQCFLSLNSRQYHGVIVQAFSEVWEIVFCDSPVKKRASIRN
ncbi:hypothetical protein NC652_007691 [Populus alba x Populus x berolinensis]|nr:hypothetical protein NC652_007691 [Populus alba x Populus x berolinensis]